MGHRAQTIEQGAPYNMPSVAEMGAHHAERDRSSLLQNITAASAVLVDVTNYLAMPTALVRVYAQRCRHR